MPQMCSSSPACFWIASTTVAGEVEQPIPVDVGHDGTVGRGNAQLGEERRAGRHRRSTALDNLDALWTGDLCRQMYRSHGRRGY